MPGSSCGKITLRLLVLVGAALLFVAAGVVGYRTWRAGDNALFEGPLVSAPEEDLPWSPGVEYTYDDWLKEGDNNPWKPDALQPRTSPDPRDYIDGAGREQFEVMMSRSHSIDTTTGASRIVRLLSPTIHREHVRPKFLTVTYPADNALFPPNLCAPWIEWTDAHNNAWQVRLAVPDAGRDWRFRAAERRWRIPDDAWREIRTLAAGREATIEVRGVLREGLFGRDRDTVHVSRPVRFSVSVDPADAYIVYRLVAPPFASYKTPDTFVRDIREREPRPFLLSRRRYCFNCHTFSSKRGDVGKVGVQARYLGQDKPELPVYFGTYDLERKRGERVKLPWPVQMTTFMAWSPDGSKLALSANQTIVTLPPLVHETQYAAQPTSDIAVYESERQNAYLLPGACEADAIEVFPRWTPDGEHIVYSRAAAGVHPALTKLQLYIVPFAGGKGGRSEPIAGAQDPEHSNYFPRFSPDGRWFSFVRSNGGCLIKSSSDLWIMDWKKRDTARPLTSNSPFTADSWHSWSSNSRWIVFATKRDDGIFARLYMTHIDDAGNASVPVRLPVDDPPMESFNIPEFLATPPAVSERDLYDAINANTGFTEARRGDE